MEIVKEYDRKDGCKVRLIADKGALSPREDECIAFGNLLTWGSRFRSPDENPYSDPDELLAELLVERLGLKGIVKGLVGKAYPGLRIMHRIYEDGGHAYALEALKPVQAGKQESWACWCDWDGGEFEQELSGEADYGYAEELADQVAGCRGTIHLLKQSGLAILPIYRFEHSGVAYSTTPFGDPWDSRLVGLAYADADDAVKTLGKEAKRLTRRALSCSSGTASRSTRCGLTATCTSWKLNRQAARRSPWAASTWSPGTRRACCITLRASFRYSMQRELAAVRSRSIA